MTFSGWAVGEMFVDGIRSHLHSVRRAMWRLQELFASDTAAYSRWHADWFSDLPGWKRWIAMVLGL